MTPEEEILERAGDLFGVKATFEPGAKFGYIKLHALPVDVRIEFQKHLLGKETPGEGKAFVQDWFDYISGRL
jgi:hypothetical protein